ncbi:hypothetical protein TWF506_000033 [Arthrobotrys conoides]|uniref:Uncharacterized protein n=1 Tax=Arthrobotrys conoides TaxID=74498 RepID=A0AAN8NK88_9PEZI
MKFFAVLTLATLPLALASPVVPEALQTITTPPPPASPPAVACTIPTAVDPPPVATEIPAAFLHATLPGTTDVRHAA